MLKSIDNLFKSFESKKTVAKKTKTTKRKSAKATKKAVVKRKPTLSGVKKAKPASNKGAVRLKAIVAKAKVIRKANPAKKWTKCVSEASKLV